MLKISAFPSNTNVDLHESPTTFSCCNIISHQLVIALNLVGLIHDTTASMHQQVPALAKNDILGSWLIACCKLAPTLARQM